MHILIKGRVQGVGFRYWLQHEAETRGVSGWARNRRDGSVEAVMSGEPEAIGDLLTSCAVGPRLADVRDIERLDELTADCSGFEIRPTV